MSWRLQTLWPEFARWGHTKREEPTVTKTIKPTNPETGAARQADNGVDLARKGSGSPARGPQVSPQ